MLLQSKTVECLACELAYRSLYLKGRFSVGCPATWLPAAPTRNAVSAYRNNRLFCWNAFESLSGVCAVWPAEHKFRITHRLSSCFKQQPLMFLQSRLKNQAQRSATWYPKSFWMTYYYYYCCYVCPFGGYVWKESVLIILFSCLLLPVPLSFFLFIVVFCFCALLLSSFFFFPSSFPTVSLSSVSYSLAPYFSWSLPPGPEREKMATMQSTGGQIIHP